MAATATRTITTVYSGDVIGTETHNAASSATSLAAVTVQDLANGANTINVPAATGATLSGVTIVPPSGNTQTLTLKGVSGDTGVALHKTDPTSLGLASTVTSFVITAGAAVSRVQFFWT